jgi:C1A family cysteine protease
MAAVSVAESIEANEFMFMKYIADFNKSYGTREEFNFRMARWIEVDAFVKEVNAPGSEYTHTAGHNKFSDFTEAEFKRMQGLKTKKVASNEPIELEDVPTNGDVNWATGTCVSPVQDQGQCGSCWAFSAASALESSYCLTGGTSKLWKLSEQQYVDCAGAKFFNFGCNGGNYTSAWNYNQQHGQMQESVYPYTAADGACNYVSADGEVSTMDGNDFVLVNGTSSSMMTATNTKTMSVSIEADKLVFQTYHSGVITSSKCGTSLDHAVIVTGYVTSSTPNYWIVRNSWGASWGLDGYVNIGMASGDGICGINMDPAQPFSQAWTA